METKEQPKPAQKAITAADVLNSPEWKNLAESCLAPVRHKIEEFKRTLKQGERIRRTPTVRLYEQGLLEQEAFTAAYACIVAHTHIDLPSTLRATIKEQGDNIFVQTYQKLRKAAEEQAAKPKKKLSSKRKAGKPAEDSGYSKQDDHNPYPKE